MSTIIPGLRGPYEQVRGIYLFGRMLDKIRLDAAGKLPDDWVAALGIESGFDGRVCRFFRLPFASIQGRVLEGGNDEEILDWVLENGYRPSGEEIEVWNGFVMKSGWRDSKSERIAFRLEEAGLPPGSVLTMFDFIDLDEGRPPRWG